MNYRDRAPSALGAKMLAVAQSKSEAHLRTPAGNAERMARNNAMLAKVGSPGGTGAQYTMPKDSEVSDHSNPRGQK